MKTDMKKNEKGVIEIIEASVSILRRIPMRVYFYYYIGSLPFVLGVFFFTVDMSQNPYARGYCAAASFGLAVLFIWMKCWQSVFALEIKAGLNKAPLPSWSLKHISQLVLLQTIIQSTGFVILPIAAIITFPFGWAFAFYQNLTVQEYTGDFSIKTSAGRAIEHAFLWPRQNHLLMGIFFLFSIIIMANLGAAFFMLPYVLKRFLGIETIFTLSGMSVMNTTFITVLIGATYLCMDPIVKTAYVLRYFYGISLESGNDLKAELKTIVPAKTTMLLLIMIFFAVLSGRPDAAIASETYITPETLDKSIDAVIVKPEYTWRIPRETKPVDVNVKEVFNPFTQALNWIKSAIKKITTPIKDFLKKIFKRFFKSSLKTGPRRGASRVEWMTAIQVLLFVLLCLTVSTLVIYLRRVWLRRKAGHIAAAPLEILVAPDLTDDSVTADELPRDRWLALAEELMAQGNLQLALRALYLASLAHLADLKMITIAHYKSNRDYEGELKRRAHEKEELIYIFSDNVRVFDRVWYGMYEVTMDDIQMFSSNCERIAAFAE